MLALQLAWILWRRKVSFPCWKLNFWSIRQPEPSLCEYSTISFPYEDVNNTLYWGGEKEKKPPTMEHILYK
jgi:hypothetical protein